MSARSIPIRQEHISAPTTLKVPNEPELALPRLLVSILQSVRVVCDVTTAEVFSRRRSQRIAWARQIAMAIASERSDRSHGELAAIFGKDRSTVSYACRTFETRIETDARAAAQVAAVRKTLEQTL